MFAVREPYACDQQTKPDEDRSGLVHQGNVLHPMSHYSQKRRAFEQFGRVRERKGHLEKECCHACSNCHRGDEGGLSLREDTLADPLRNTDVCEQNQGPEHLVMLRQEVGGDIDFPSEFLPCLVPSAEETENRRDDQ